MKFLNIQSVSKLIDLKMVEKCMKDISMFESKASRNDQRKKTKIIQDLFPKERG